ncbi:unnamed protein product [Spirodela intermedia]|uniref:Uncharacterized protein n=2 Tax=Spirodela intermedia TaxID=51605 RepID=A0A7I8KU29_SPIIN|nr:unnamed protein product [Spirodela intermedia]CAA6664702.1 unnamed protein product [Spirodela intermedia]CAA7401300.1 unnamed protein product [Spirodela intermedia]
MEDDRADWGGTVDLLLAPAGGRHGECRSMLQAREEFFHRFDCGGRMRRRYELDIASSAECPSGEKRKQRRRRSKGTPQLCSSVFSYASSVILLPVWMDRRFPENSKFVEPQGFGDSAGEQARCRILR